MTELIIVNFREVKTNLMHIFLTIYLTSILVPIILRFVICKSQFSKSCSPYTFKYPLFLVLLFLIGAFAIIALCVGAYLQDNEVQLELQIFIISFYSIFAFAVIWHFLKTLNFKLVLAEDFMIYRNLLGITKEIQYEEVSRIKTYTDKSHNVIKYKIYIGETRIVVENFTTNFNDFPKIMKRRLKKAKCNVQFE